MFPREPGLGETLRGREPGRGVGHQQAPARQLGGELGGGRGGPDEVLGVLGGVGQLGHLQAVVALQHSGHRLVAAAGVEGRHTTCAGCVYGVTSPHTAPTRYVGVINCIFGFSMSRRIPTLPFLQESFRCSPLVWVWLKS